MQITAQNLGDKSSGSARACRWAILVVGCLVAVGCAGPQPVEVSGEVTFDGKPVPVGRIYFNPDYTKGNDGQQGYAEIRNGKYDTRNGGQGACGGPTIAVIRGFEAGPASTPELGGDPLFRDFKEEIDLPKESCTRDFKVPASASSTVRKPPPGAGKL